MYKAFSYSEEYDTTVEVTRDEMRTHLTDLADRGDGVLVTDLEELHVIFSEFVTDIDKIFDPRFLFAILMIILFLMDIAVRKFKFKWLHEIIRDYKKKKELQNKN